MTLKLVGHSIWWHTGLHQSPPSEVKGHSSQSNDGLPMKAQGPPNQYQGHSGLFQVPYILYQNHHNKYIC